MSSQSLAEAMRDMESYLTETLVEFTSKKVHELSEEIKEDLELEYDHFFPMISQDVIFAASTPGVLRRYTEWQPLSDKWSYTKATSNFYVGLSNSQTRGRQLSRKGWSGASRLSEHNSPSYGYSKVGSFSSYIESLNKAGTTARFFGPVSVSYFFVSPSPNVMVYPKQSNSIVTRTDVRNSGKFMKFVGDLSMGATISAFGNLKGVSFDEWHIVDYIIKRIDPSNEKQWVKINSTYGIGRSHRPIRAVITPILKYYLQQRFPKIVRDAVSARRTG